jgi:hypothetical protein
VEDAVISVSKVARLEFKLGDRRVGTFVPSPITEGWWTIEWDTGSVMFCSPAVWEWECLDLAVSDVTDLVKNSVC